MSLPFLLCISMAVFMILNRETDINELAKCKLNTTASTFEDFKGDFSLVNEDGLTVSSDHLLDQPSLLYFGYTFCPDICPFDLMRNAQAVELLALEDITIKPLFISVDPSRDSPSVLKNFTSFHHPNMIGLTGSTKQLDRVKNIYKVYSEIPKDMTADYIVNHSTFSYFILPKLGVQTYFTRSQKPKELASKMKCIIDTKLSNPENTK